MKKSRKNILLTGGLGFIGSHVAELLLKEGNYVYIVDKKTYAANLDFEKELKQKYSEDQYDLLCLDMILKEVLNVIIREHKIDWVINCAAETHVDNSFDFDRQEDFINSNILGVQCLLEVCYKNNIKFCQFSTDEVYSVPDENQRFYETDPLNPKNPYSATKAAADMLIETYKNTYGFNTVTVRPSNNFGERQNEEKLLPKVIKKILNEEKIGLYGDGLATREWTYVGTTAKSVLSIIENDITDGIYNITEGNELTNLELVERVCKELNKKLEDVIEFVEDRPGHDMAYRISNQKALDSELLEISNFDENLKNTIDFYKDKHGRKK